MTMKSRLLVAAVGIPLLLVILLFCPKIITAIALAILCAVGAREMLLTTGILKHPRMLLYSMLAALLIPLWSGFGSPILPFAIGTVVFALLLFIEALLAYPEVSFAGVTGALFSGIVIPLCLSGIVRLLIQDQGRFLVLIPIMIPFIADAGAYFAGRFFGKHKLAPLLSPHKTIEGFIGGLVIGILSMVIYGLVMQFAFGFAFRYIYAGFVGLVGSLVSAVGDLSFSMVKRETGIKDYGTIFKAHGGVLYRFDSVVFATPVVELMLLLLPVLK